MINDVLSSQMTNKRGNNVKITDVLSTQMCLMCQSRLDMPIIYLINVSFHNKTDLI